MSRSLIIVAHGSSVNPGTAETVSKHAEALARRASIRDAFDLVEARFLKQAPFVSEIDWGCDEAVVIPFFMADGWFVRNVLPRELELDPFDDLPATRRRGPCKIVVTPPLGVAPDLVEVVGELASSHAREPHIVLVGHGTPRHPESTSSVELVALTLNSDFASVTTRFVDDQPPTAETWSDTTHAGGEVVVVPYFAFRGPHVLEDIPEALGLPDASLGPHHIAGRTVWYTEPVGEHPAVVDVLERLAIHEP